MKRLLLTTFALMMAVPTTAVARESQAGYSNQCFREVYREEYTPGTAGSPGYVRSWTEQVEIPCSGNQVQSPVRQTGPVYQPPGDNNSCIEGAVLGGLVGAAGGAALSRDEGNLIGIPLGIVGGALIGCQVDGG